MTNDIGAIVAGGRRSFYWRVVSRRGHRGDSCLTQTHGPMIDAMDYKGRIVIDPEIRFGKPCVHGTRITVGDVLSYLASGMREDQILADFPQLTQEDIRACLAFAAERVPDCE